MATPFKDLYAPDLYNSITDLINDLMPSFSKKAFLAGIFTEDWEQKELRSACHHPQWQRM